MITKGIIKSIDLLGNTCTVHIPFFETAGNDPIIETATVSNTPGSYNGYKVGDAVYVAFEDGNMSTPVIIGKLYLGTEKEKADPRGVSNVEESTATKKATLPADSKLTAEIDSTVPNTTVPYSSLSSIANGLNKLNTDVGQMDRDYGNRFKQVISDIDGNRSLIEQTADRVVTKVSGSKYKKDENGNVLYNEKNEPIIDPDATTEEFGWELQKDSWTITSNNTEVLTVNSDGLTVKGDITAETGHIGKFAIGEIHKNKSDNNIEESGIYTDDYIRCFLHIPGEDNNDPVTNESYTAAVKGVYIGTDGIKLGSNFSVDATGQMTASALTLIQTEIGTLNNTTKTELDELKTAVQSKSTISYSNSTPAKPKQGDCWFDTSTKTLQQCISITNEAATWADIGGELVANKVTATYINGFDITAKKIDIGNTFSADTASSTVMLGGFTVNDTEIKSINENLQLKSSGDIIAKSGDIGGFTLTATSIASGDGNLQLNSAGNIVAKAGDIGGFEINPSGKKEGLYSDYLYLNSEQVYFPVQSYLNLNDKVKIYSATPTGGSQTSYISTVNNTDFIIQNQSGAGIKFAKDDTTTNVAVNLTVTLSNPTYKYENKTYTNQWGVSNGSGQKNWLYSIYANYTVSLSQLLPHPVTGKLILSWSRATYSPYEPMSGYSGNFGEINFTIPAYTTSVTLSSRVYEHSIQSSGYTIKIAKINDTAVTEGDTATLSIANYSNTNKSIYSLGHFLPNGTGCSLGSDAKVWSSLHIQAATQYNSDNRLKNSVQPLSPELDAVYDVIKPVSYKFNDGTSDRRHFGFIAQDLQQSLKELNINTKDFAPLCIPQNEDEFMSVRYTEFIPLNTDQIQKLKKRVTDQEARITELEEAIKKLKTK